MVAKRGSDCSDRFLLFRTIRVGWESVFSIDSHLGLCFCCASLLFLEGVRPFVTDQWVFRDNLFSIHCAFDRVCWARNED